MNQLKEDKIKNTKTTEHVRYHCTGCKRVTGSKDVFEHTYDDGEVCEETERIFHGTNCRVCKPEDAGWNYEGPEMRARMVCPWCEEGFTFRRFKTGHIHTCRKHPCQPVHVLLSHEWTVAVSFEATPIRSRWIEKKEFKGRYGTYKRRFEVTGHGNRVSSGKALVFLKPLGRHHGQHKEPVMNPDRLVKMFKRTDGGF